MSGGVNVPLTVTGVGSRDIPYDALREVYRVGVRFGQAGATLRSGRARNTDTAFEEGVLSGGGSIEIYLPGPSFGGRSAGGPYIDATKLKNWDKAMELAQSVHPNWNAVLKARSDFTLRAHTRNAFQVLGRDLNTPADVLVCWAPPTLSGVKGGTNTAWQIAKLWDIPRFNLAVEEDCLELKAYLLELRK